MKKVLCVLIVAFLLSGAVAVTLGEEVHELWGIPYGSDSETIVELASERGILCEKNSFRSGVRVLDDQALSFLGYPLETIYFTIFNEEDGLRSISIYLNDFIIREEDDDNTLYSSDQDAETAKKWMDQFLSLVTIFEEQYGAPTTISAWGTYREESVLFRLGKQELSNIALSGIKSRELDEIDVHYGNISVACWVGTPSEGKIELATGIIYYDSAPSQEFLDRVFSAPLYGTDEPIIEPEPVLDLVF